MDYTNLVIKRSSV